MKHKELRKQFADLDLDDSGGITPEELLARMPEGSLEDARQVLAMLDLNGDGKISLEEFLAAYGD